MQMADVKKAPLYIAVSLFLAFTSVFFAAAIEGDYRRLKIIFNAYLLVGMLSSVLGIAGYLGLFLAQKSSRATDVHMAHFRTPMSMGLS